MRVHRNRVISTRIACSFRTTYMWARYKNWVDKHCFCFYQHLFAFEYLVCITLVNLRKWKLSTSEAVLDWLWKVSENIYMTPLPKYSVVPLLYFGSLLVHKVEYEISTIWWWDLSMTILNPPICLINCFISLKSVPVLSLCIILIGLHFPHSTCVHVRLMNMIFPF